MGSKVTRPAFCSLHLPQPVTPYFALAQNVAHDDARRLLQALCARARTRWRPPFGGGLPGTGC